MRPVVQLTAADNSAAIDALERMRPDCEKREGRSPVAVALRHCFENRLQVPDWLQGAFLALFDGLQRAEFESWDAALGAWWPDGTRFDDVRGQLALDQRIPAAMWDLFLAKPDRAINDRLFAQVGARPGIHKSGDTVMRHYGRLVRDGRALPLTALRAAARAATHPHVDPIELQVKPAP